MMRSRVTMFFCSVSSPYLFTFFIAGFNEQQLSSNMLEHLLYNVADAGRDLSHSIPTSHIRMECFAMFIEAEALIYYIPFSSQFV